MLIRLSLFFLHPVIIVSLGTLLALIPHFLGGGYTELYSDYVYNDKVLWVYFLGFSLFLAGYSCVSFLNFCLRRKTVLLRSTIPQFFYLRLLICLALIAFSIKLISIYGGVPVFDIAAADGSISNVNEAQVGSGGFFGLVFLSVFLMIILYPNSFDSSGAYAHRLLFLIQTGLILFFCVYTGKRQMFFIFSTFLFAFSIIYLYRLGEISRLNRIFPYVILLVLGAALFFVVIGNIRYENDNLFSVDPILNYLSLPYINITGIINLVDSSNGSPDFDSLYNVFVSGAPSILKSYLGGGGEVFRIEKTSPSGIYEVIYWNFQLAGVACFMFLLGWYVAFIYKGAMQSGTALYIYIYALTIWPLFSLFMYNHFLNWMFYMLPVSLVLSLAFFDKVKIKV